MSSITRNGQEKKSHNRWQPVETLVLYGSVDIQHFVCWNTHCGRLLFQLYVWLKEKGKWEYHPHKLVVTSTIALEVISIVFLPRELKTVSHSTCVVITIFYWTVEEARDYTDCRWAETMFRYVYRLRGFMALDVKVRTIKLPSTSCLLF